MIVYYRLSSKGSKHENERPIYANDKKALVEFCLKSFVKAFSTIKPEIVFLFDEVPDDWIEMMERTVPFKMDAVRLDDASQASSYFTQLNKARKVKNHEIVYFQEDDYFYIPNHRVGEKIITAISKLGFVSPYDHLEFYKMPDYHPSGPYEIMLINNHHFRTERFNTMTWGTTTKLLNEYFDTLMIHGYLDKPTWAEMRKAGAKIWSPIPSLSTHMHNHWLAPGIEWSKYFDVAK